MAHVTIVGAGAVGVACATSILHQGLAASLVLADVNARKAEGEALDFAHGVGALPRGSVTVRAVPMSELPGGTVCVITAGAKQRPGETRLELLHRNIEALKSIVGCVRRGGPYAHVLLVTNPVDVMTELARRLLPSGASVLGSGTVLDTLRLRALLAERLAVSPESVHALVVGEHGDSSVCLFDAARIGGQPLRDFAARQGRPLSEDEVDLLATDVRRAAYAVIERKGATSHAIGLAVARIVRALVHDERVVLPVSGPYDDRLSIAQPFIVGASGARPVGLPPLSAVEREAWERSVAVVREATAALDAPS